MEERDELVKEALDSAAAEFSKLIALNRELKDVNKDEIKSFKLDVFNVVLKMKDEMRQEHKNMNKYLNNKKSKIIKKDKAINATGEIPMVPVTIIKEEM